jgi:SERRATE/Ars2, N-terminal domain
MFEHHRKSPWFAEKYEPSPEFVSLRMRLRKEGWSGRLNTFFLDLEAGKFDPDFTEPEQDSISPAKEAPTNGASSENPEISLGPAGAEETKNIVAGDEDMQNVDVEDEAGENEAGRPETNGRGLKDSKHNNRGEEVSVMPEGNQVMIRTIPPDIGRLRLEEVSLLNLIHVTSHLNAFFFAQACGKVPGFVYLALGDPLQKRNYYRAGWLKFREDVDMSVVMSELTDKKVRAILSSKVLFFFQRVTNLD